MNEFDELDRELSAAFAQRPSTLSRPSLRDVRQRARRRQRQRQAGVLSACAVVGIGGVAVIATRSPNNRTTIGAGDSTPTNCEPTVSTSVSYDAPILATTTLGEVYTQPTAYFPSGTTYVLQDGDNPTTVAAQFGVTLEALNFVNSGTAGYDAFFVGLEIVIPEPMFASTYTLQPGDHPGKVAEMFGVTVRELDAVNEDVPGYGGFIVGTVIRIPFSTTGTTMPPMFADTTTTYPTNSTESDGEIQSFYVIGSNIQGDSREAIAMAWGVTVEELDAANVNTPGYAEWVVGTFIRIPTPFVSTTTPSEVDCEPANNTESTVTTIILDQQTDAPTTTPISFPTKQGTVVQVANCSNQEGVARLMSDALAAEGFTMAEPDTCTIDLARSKILYNPDDPLALPVAQTLALYLGNVDVEPSGPVVPTLTTGTWIPGSNVIVLLGNDLAGKTLAQIAGEQSSTSTTEWTTTTAP